LNCASSCLQNSNCSAFAYDESSELCKLSICDNDVPVLSDSDSDSASEDSWKVGKMVSHILQPI